MKISAAVFRSGSAEPNIEELDLTGPGPGEVLVRMVGTGVCHTDLKSAGSASPVPRPVVLGHEGAG
ncbi:MAG: alcohol dehydrogenase catalytic domain-containing protein, partial [Rhodospirillales bacterium]|nr:alcohol dehydrogenase catalytic domain-containing protein [Rhodospirillales bacterium]